MNRQRQSQLIDDVAVAKKSEIINRSSQKMTTTKSLNPSEPISQNINQINGTSNNRNQFSSFILFVTVIIIVNLCPFQSNLTPTNGSGSDNDAPNKLLQGSMNHEQLSYQMASANDCALTGNARYLSYIETCVGFVRLMFTNPVRLGKRTTRFIQAEAKTLARMRRNDKRYHNHYYRPSQGYMQHQQALMYHRAAANQIINNYRPSPPTYIDHAEGLYGQYNNAYGRQDGGYHIW